MLPHPWHRGRRPPLRLRPHPAETSRWPSIASSPLARRVGFASGPPVAGVGPSRSPTAIAPATSPPTIIDMIASCESPPPRRARRSEAALVHDQCSRSHMPEQLRHLRGDQRSRPCRPRRASPIERVDLDLGADVDAARGLVEDQHVGARCAATCARHDLLLVAAGEVHDARCATFGVRMRKPLPEALRDADLRVRRRSLRGATRATRGPRASRSSGSTVVEHEPEPLAVLGHVGEAGVDGPRLRSRDRRLPRRGSAWSPREARAVAATEQAHRELGAPGAHQARDADDLAGGARASTPRRPRTRSTSGCSLVADAPVAHLEERRRRGLRALARRKALR